MNRQKPGLGGFTLVELMIVVAIIAILSSIALPAYQNYIRESRRVDAQATLHDLQQRQEKYRINHDSYTCATSELSLTETNSYYRFDIPVCTSTAYTLTAVAISSQTGDTGCTTLTLNQNGVVDPPNCWKK